MADGVPQTFRYASQWVKGTVTQLSNLYWNAPFGNGTLVAFVQDDNDKTIMQSVSAPAQWPTGIQPLSAVISQASVYPNPAIDHTSIAFKLESDSKVGLQVVNALGSVVYSVPAQNMTVGTQMFEIPTTSLAVGVYTIKVQAEGSTITERFSVVK